MHRQGRIDLPSGMPSRLMAVTDTGWTVTGWSSTLSDATLNSAVLNGSVRLPSDEVPSGNRIRVSPASSRLVDVVPMDAGVPYLAVHEDGLLKLRQKAEEGPSADLRLGDEGSPDQRSQDDDIQV